MKKPQQGMQPAKRLGRISSRALLRSLAALVVIALVWAISSLANANSSDGERLPDLKASTTETLTVISTIGILLLVLFVINVVWLRKQAKRT